MGASHGPLGTTVSGTTVPPQPVGPRGKPTHPRVAGQGRPRHKAEPDEMPPLEFYSSWGWMFRRATFFAELQRQKFPAIKAEATKHLGALLGYIEDDKEVTDLRWVAYMLATVQLECAGTWLPIEEYGKGAGHKSKPAKDGKPARPGYGDPVTVKDAAGKTYTNTYYGRGFVQLTWEKNYRTCGAELHRLGLVSSDDELVIHPERALEPALAYPIMSFGMRKGIFTGVSLKKYIHGATCDYYNARRIINGTDAAQTIEGYAKKIEKALSAAWLLVGDFDPRPDFPIYA